MYLRHRYRGFRYEETPWYCVRVSAAQLNARQHERIRLAFNRAYMSTRWSKGMSLWIARHAEGGADIFLSPAAVAAEPGLVHRFNATRACAPTQAVELLAGDDHGVECRALRQQRLPMMKHTRAHLPATYSYRSVRNLEETPRYQRHELAPFVRRYLDAWSPPSRPSPGGLEEGMQR